MKTRMAYCSACDRNVRVVLQPGREPMVIDEADAHGLVCLEYGETCTGDMCPLFEVPTERMKEAFDRHTNKGG